mmetsp:Transcript_125367/g.315844  ORF Transcript_125367/g.315844 Transcript_125367/m.315844 type:complete len:468 (+) Transcript_125367:157-1560(+)
MTTVPPPLCLAAMTAPVAGISSDRDRDRRNGPITFEREAKACIRMLEDMRQHVGRAGVCELRLCEELREVRRGLEALVARTARLSEKTPKIYGGPGPHTRRSLPSSRGVSRGSATASPAPPWADNFGTAPAHETMGMLPLPSVASDAPAVATRTSSLPPPVGPSAAAATSAGSSVAPPPSGHSGTPAATVDANGDLAMPWFDLVRPLPDVSMEELCNPNLHLSQILGTVATPAVASSVAAVAPPQRAASASRPGGMGVAASQPRPAAAAVAARRRSGGGRTTGAGAELCAQQRPRCERRFGPRAVPPRCIAIANPVLEDGLQLSSTCGFSGMAIAETTVDIARSPTRGAWTASPPAAEAAELPPVQPSLVPSPRPWAAAEADRSTAAAVWQGQQLVPEAPLHPKEETAKRRPAPHILMSQEVPPAAAVGDVDAAAARAYVRRLLLRGSRALRSRATAVRATAAARAP